MEIKLLPKSVRDDLRTGITIRSIAHCIIQLVLNSLDAKSTSIAIRVNLITSKIQVIDNGVGISKTNLKLLGFRYATSKYFSEKELETNQHIFGFKGEALSSIIKLSKIVTVTSKSSASSNTYSKRFENGQLSKITPVNQRPTIGTTIHVEDLMYNMPVRKNHMKLSNCFDEILNEIESIAIIHPHTSFSIRNDSNGEIVFQTYKSKFVYQTAAVLYGKEFSKWLRKIYFLENNFTLNGLIRIQPTQNKIQFIYVNKRLVKKSNIHNCINNLLNKSLIINSTESTKFKYISYIINIKSPKSLYDILDYTDVVIEFKNWDEVLKLIEVGVMKFLKKHQLHKSPKPIKGFDLLIGSPVYADEHTFRASQVRGMIRGLPMKRKLESCSGSSSKMMKINSNSVPKLETPKADLNILELNKVVSQVSSIDSIETINNGKDIIMDIFLKSTAVYGQKDQIDADKSFETASKYTNRSICILTGNEDTNCTNYSFTSKLLINKNPPNNNKTEHLNKPNIVDGFKNPITNKFKLKISQINTVPKQQITNNKLIKNKRVINKKDFKNKYNFKLSSSESTYSHRTLTSFKYKNFKYTIKKRVTRKYVQTADFIKPILNANKIKNGIMFKNKVNHENVMLKSWYDFRRNKSKLNRVIPQIKQKKLLNLFDENTNRMEQNRYNHFNYQNIDNFVPNKQLKLFKPKICNKQNLTLHNLLNSNKKIQIFHDDTLKMLPHSKINNPNNQNNSFDQTDLNISLLPLSPLPNVNDSYNFPKVNYNTTLENIENFQNISFEKNSTVNKLKLAHNQNNFNTTINDLNLTMYSTNSLLCNNINVVTDLLNKQNVIDKQLIITPQSTTDESYLYLEKSYISNSNETINKNKSILFCPQDNFIPYQTNPNLATKAINKYKIPPNYIINNDESVGVSNSNNTCSRFYPNTRNNNDQISIEMLNLCNTIDIINDENPLEVSNPLDVLITRNTNSALASNINNEIPLDQISDTNCRYKRQKHQTSKDTNIAFNNKFPTKCTLNVELTPNILNISDNNNKITTKNHLNNSINPEGRRLNNTDLLKYEIPAQLNKINQNGLNNINSQYIFPNTYDSHANLHTNTNNKNESLVSKRSEHNSSLTTKSDDLFLSNSITTINKIIAIANASQNSLDMNQKCILENNSNTLGNELDNNDDNLESQIINNTNSSNNSNAMEMCYNEVINDTFTDSNKNQDESENTLTELKNDNTKIKETNNDYIYNKSETKDVPNAKTDKSNDNSSNLLRNIPKICSLSPINLENQTEWSKSTTLSGNLFYLNDRTGMSSFLTPKSTETYSMSKRYSFMPKGMSQNIIPKSTVTIKSLSPNSKQCLYDTITNSDDYLKKTKWMNFFKTKGKSYTNFKSRFIPKINIPDSESFFNHLYSDKRYFETTIPSISSSKVSKKVVNALDNFRFSKESINKITIINQWDCKFILAKIFINAETEILVCFDQHAVHERIRLEQLFEDYYQIKNETLKSVNCNVAITLKMGDSDIRMLQNYRLNFENWGFFYKVTQDKCVIFTKIPKCWQSKDDSNVGSNSCLKTLLELLIQEENNWLRNVGHMHTALPLIILNDIKMEACRGAIKFGDTLTKEECSEYIKKLSTCDLPFQCAHGRPTLVPIFNLKETTTKRIMNIKSESTRIEKVT